MKVNYEIIDFLLQKGANLCQVSLDDKTCQDFLEEHCNRS